MAKAPAKASAVAKKTEEAPAPSLSLMDRLMGVVEETGIEQGADLPPLPTGIDVLDYHNGKIHNGEVHVGINPGHIITIVGGTGVGKSTLAEQIAGAFTKEDPNSGIYKYDFERAGTVKRFQNVARWSDAEIAAKYRLLKKGLSSERTREAIMKMSHTKLQYESALTRPCPIYGTPCMPPTVAIIDSVMAMVSNRVAGVAKPKGDADDAAPAEVGKALDKAAETSNMEGAQDAKTNNQTARAIVGPAYDANITVISVNHIRKKVDTGLFKEKAEVYGMKQSETMPGGTGFPQFSDFLLRLDPEKRLTPDAEYGITGYTVTCTIIKSRNAPAGKSFVLVYDQNCGFDNILSNLHFMRINKLLKGSGVGMYIDGHDQKFSLKNFKERYLANEGFARVFDGLLESHLIATIGAEFVATDIESLPEVPDNDTLGDDQATTGEAA